ncbi:MAG TPA: SEC-C metal-binding domain-containing protein, partial [Terriglobales bacterium]|nr:SEC-C metal-binding domain-containing protein [Terriglobales bacterium]
DADSGAPAAASSRDGFWRGAAGRTAAERTGGRSSGTSWRRWQWPPPARMVSTSADDLEEAFMRRKRRELEQARMAGAGDAQPPVQQVIRGEKKVGRNDLCPCGSGQKYKKCHGRVS